MRRINYLILSILFFGPTMSHADTIQCDRPNCMDETSIRKPDDYIRKEPVTPVERYNPKDLENDPTVLVSAPQKEVVKVMVNQQELQPKTIVKYVVEKPIQQVKTSATLCDEDTGSCTDLEG